MSDWFKSSYSDTGGKCLECRNGERVDVRDSVHPEQGHLTFPPGEFEALLKTVTAR